MFQYKCMYLFSKTKYIFKYKCMHVNAQDTVYPTHNKFFMYLFLNGCSKFNYYGTYLIFDLHQATEELRHCRIFFNLANIGTHIGLTPDEWDT